jgi:pimeloyl-ACP methyl ester carboxylesterase
VLVGRVDSELSIDNAMLFAASLPVGHFVAIEHAGHFPFIEAPATTWSAIEPFLHALRPPAKP